MLAGDGSRFRLIVAAAAAAAAILASRLQVQSTIGPGDFTLPGEMAACLTSKDIEQKLQSPSQTWKGVKGKKEW